MTTKITVSEEEIKRLVFSALEETSSVVGDVCLEDCQIRLVARDDGSYELIIEFSETLGEE